ncbi:MAG: T9SS type A sorting domain-containing protein [Bacteroidota bacterium]|nr:T9SS type A sorting domain-containing protein [Bacteroidota bacterium]
MKNLHFTLFALLIVSMGNAQFFQRVYGVSNTREVLESGANYNGGISISQKGFVMTGHTPAGSTVNINSVMLTRTDLSGLPVFNNRIAIKAQFSFQQLSAKAKKVISLANGQIAVFGDYNNGLSTSTIPVSNQFFLMVTDALGNPLYVRSYSIGTIPFQAEATSIVQSPTDPNRLYACGYTATAQGSKQPVVMSIDAASGFLNWGFTYLDASTGAFEWTAEDIVESPYPNPNSAQTDIVLVGRYVLNQGDIGQGTFSTIDAATGAATSTILQFGDPFFDGGFNAITVANNNQYGNPGFAIAGYTMSNSFLSPNYNAWALKVDPVGNLYFSTALDYSASNRNDFAYDIVERVNTFGDYEYYVGGYVDQGYFGNEDEVVYKLTYYGLPVASGSEFTYGGPGNDRVLELDYYNFGVPTSNVGLSMFNSTTGSFATLGQGDFYHVRSYFNGITACNFILDNAQYLYGPGFYNESKQDQDQVNSTRARSLLWEVTPMQNALICTASSVTGGANTRLGENGEDEEVAVTGSNVFPNPLTSDNQLLNIQFDIAGSGEDIQIEVMNSLGQVCMKSTQTLGDGQTQIQVNFGENGMLNAGVYVVVIYRGGEVFTHNVSVQ